MKKSAWFLFVVGCLLMFRNGWTEKDDFYFHPEDDECTSHFLMNGPDFKFATVKGGKGSKTYFLRSSIPEGCPNETNPECRSGEYLVPGNRVLVSRRFRRWVCGWDMLSQGRGIGWIPVADLEFIDSHPDPGLEKWVGTWVYDENSLRIRSEKKGLRVDGKAIWRNPGVTAHYAEIHAVGIPQGTELQVRDADGDVECKVRLRLIDDVLVVGDNNCGGGNNARFSGVFQRREMPRKAQRKGIGI